MNRIFISLLSLLSIGAQAHALDPKINLARHITACDLAGFQETWKSYHTTATPHELVTTKAQLSELITELKKQTHEKIAQKLGNIKQRVKSGIFGAVGAALAISFTGLGIWIFMDKAKDIRDDWKFKNTRYKKLQEHIQFIILLSLGCGACTTIAGRPALRDINDARYADTQALVQQIEILDTMLVLLSHEQVAPINQN